MSWASIEAIGTMRFVLIGAPGSTAHHMRVLTTRVFSTSLESYGYALIGYESVPTRCLPISAIDLVRRLTGSGYRDQVFTNFRAAAALFTNVRDIRGKAVTKINHGSGNSFLAKKAPDGNSRFWKKMSRTLIRARNSLPT